MFGRFLILNISTLSLVSGNIFFVIFGIRLISFYEFTRLKVESDSGRIQSDQNSDYHNFKLIYPKWVILLLEHSLMSLENSPIRFALIC